MFKYKSILNSLQNRSSYNIKFRKCVFFLTITLIGIFSIGCNQTSSQNESYNEVDAIFKPMVKVDGIVYALTKDNCNIDESKLQKVGVVTKSLKSAQKNVKLSDANGTSNIYDIGTKIFIIDEQNGVFVEVLKGVYSLHESFSD